MTDGHAHDTNDVVVSKNTRRLLVVVVVPLLLALVVGVVALWPGALRSDHTTDAAAADELFTATVTAVEHGPCDGTAVEDGITCSTPSIRLEEGPDAGDEVALFEEADSGGLDVEVGDEVVVGYYPDAGEGLEYSLVDHDRHTSLLLLGALLAVALIAFGRWKGARTLGTVIVSIAVLAVFVLPALLDGSDPVLVALVAAGVIVGAALYIGHGVNAGSTIALLGALASLAVVGGLAWLFVGLTELTGRSVEADLFVQVSAPVELNGLLLAGIVIGTLGVLVDVVASQVAAVWALQRAEPDSSRREVGRAALRVGTARVASSVNTLVLAYAGAALPLLILFTQAHQSVADTAGSEVVATEIVRAVVGAVGLAAAVPITTLLATWLLGRRELDAAPNDPRRYRSRAERELWEREPAAATEDPAPPPAL